MSDTLSITYIDCDQQEQTKNIVWNGSSNIFDDICIHIPSWNQTTISVNGSGFTRSEFMDYISFSSCDGTPIPSGSCGNYEVNLAGGSSAIFSYVPCGSPLTLSVNLTSSNTPMEICADFIPTPQAVNISWTYMGSCDSGNISGKVPVSRCVLYEIYIKDISPSRPSNDRIITYDNCNGTTISTTLDYTISRTHFIEGTEDTIVFNSNVYEIRNIIPI